MRLQARTPRFDAYCKEFVTAKPALMSKLSKSYAELQAAQEACEMAAASICRLAEIAEKVCKIYPQPLL